MATLTMKPKVRLAPSVKNFNAPIPEPKPWTPHPDDFNYEDGIARVPKPWLREAMEDARLGRNMAGPFATAEEAVANMLREMEKLEDEDEEI